MRGFEQAKGEPAPPPDMAEDSQAAAMKIDRQARTADLIRILRARSTGLHIEQLEQIAWTMRHPGSPMPARFRAVVTGLLSRHSAQSTLFRQKNGKPADDLFYSPEGKGSGTWAVHAGRAEAWLRRRGAG